ncbi:hypothetical protein C8R46DRAFT_879601 [Mycena filopes]|nr:hypothetical protein C8R46DRAFT_879601 [Mycena filopes]
MSISRAPYVPTNHNPQHGPIQPHPIDPDTRDPNIDPPRPLSPTNAPPRPPSPTNDPEAAPDVTVRLEDFKITNRFIEALRNASLEDPTEALEAHIIELIRNPPREAPQITPDQRLSIDLFLAVTTASEQTYTSARDAIQRRHPDDPVLSYYEVKKLVQELSGVVHVTRDMCPDSCIAYTGPFATLLLCPYCGKARYDPIYEGAQVPRLQFNTILIGPLLQALRRSHEGATELRYRERLTRRILKDLADNDDVKTLPYTDFFDGSDYIEAERSGKIKPGDNVLMLSVDGAQLYRNKTSDCWIAAWVVLDKPPWTRYKKTGIYHG